MPRSRFGMWRSRDVALAGMILVLSACSFPRYARHAEPPPPPPPPPLCSAVPAPPRWFDTLRPTQSGAAYWSISRVQGASSASNEFGLIPLERNRALLFEGSANRNARPVVVRRVDPTRVDRLSDDEADASIEDQQVMLTSFPPGRIMGDAAVSMATISGRDISTETVPVIDQETVWDGHPAVTPDGRWVIFASDREGASGGADLWYASITSGTIGTIRPLHGVNTPCDELSPFVSERGRLLFSSAGHSSHGGYDVHEARLLEEADSLRAIDVANLGTPLNSPADEIFPVMLKDSTFYVASTRSDGRGPDRSDFDILVMHRRRVGEDPIINPETPTAMLVGKVVNSATNSPVVDAEVIARLPQSTDVLASTRTDTAGSYQLRIPVERSVEITAQNNELFFDSFVTTIPASEKDRIVKPEKPLGLSPTYTLRVNFPTAVFDAPYPFTLDSNGVELTRPWSRDVDDLIRNVKAGAGKVRKLILTGHTDDVDSDESNLVLGKQRVQFIIDRLVEGGLPATMLEGRSAGEQQLLPRRPDEPMESWRRRCRRVELVKVQ